MIRVRAAVALVGAAVWLAGCGGQAHQRPWQHYVAIGDSYTAGAGIDPVTEAGCFRSAADYPTLVAHRLSIPEFVDASCGSAAVLNAHEPQPVSGATNPPQLRGVDKLTRLVTVGIGLNNSGFSGEVLYACLTTAGVPNPTCTAFAGLDPAGLAQQVTAVADSVGELLDEIHRRAPAARIVLVGYPRLLPDAGSCPDRLPLVPEAVANVRAAMKLLNAEYERVARAAGATYVDTWSASEGHDVCSADPWVAGISAPTGGGAAVHPLAAYHRAVADLIVSALGSRSSQ